MITVELTSVSGTVKEMPFENKERVLEFIERYADALPLGTAVNINAPLIGIHSGWIQGRKTNG
jgi:hypothetical protein